MKTKAFNGLLVQRSVYLHKNYGGQELWANKSCGILIQLGAGFERKTAFCS
ncbi:hypothetical protein [Bartonella elizabethae]|uniref:hypothetical protein n=1 Tax=Bartonella elizabethae TaxID=807 RepID=UPI00031CA935|nr:hypothetical protein [Bartonella elizabethae]